MSYETTLGRRATDIILDPSGRIVAAEEAGAAGPVQSVTDLLCSLEDERDPSQSFGVWMPQWGEPTRDVLDARVAEDLAAGAYWWVTPGPAWPRAHTVPPGGYAGPGGMY